MQTTISVTNKWQLHIPKLARKTLGLKKPGKMELKASKDKIVITPVKKSILDYAGKYHYLINKTNKKINLERLRDYIDYSDL